MAATLGTKFMSNFQKVVDYRASCKILEIIWAAVGISLHIFTNKNHTSIDEILKTPSNEFVKVWIHFWKWTSLWRAHKLGIRTGNWDLQIESLSAFAPLFAVAGKFNYAFSVCHFLAVIDERPQLASILRHVSSVNLTGANHYFAFDEALETYGVKFIKQYLTKKPMDDETLKLQMKSAQSEQQRINSLVSEFLEPREKVRSERVVESRRDSLWKLVDDLLDIFKSPDLNLENHLLKKMPELNTNGYNLLFNCYNIGKERMETLLKQEVYGTEEKPIKGKGRGMRNVNIYMYEDIQELYSKKKKRASKSLNPNICSGFQVNPSAGEPSSNPSSVGNSSIL